MKPIRRSFPRSRVVVDTIDSTCMWDGDLADVSNLSSENDAYNFLFDLIYIFSRFLFIIPLKNKQLLSVTNGLKSVFQTGRKPHTLRTDKGSEFKNRWVSKPYSLKTNLRQIMLKELSGQRKTLCTAIFFKTEHIDM